MGISHQWYLSRRIRLFLFLLPLKVEHICHKPSLEHIDSNQLLHDDFEKISACWSSDFTNGAVISLLSILSCTKW